MMNFSNKKVLTILAFSSIAVLGHWNFWSNGIYALGFNTTIFWLFLGLILWNNNPVLTLKKDWVWATPLLLMALSFSLFENPWLKIISCVVLPVSTSIFYAYSQLINARQRFWGVQLLQALIKRSVTPFQHIGGALNYSKSLLVTISGQHNNQLSKRIFYGILLLIPIATMVLVLLSSADENFARLTNHIVSQFFNSLDLGILAKVCCIFILCIFLLAALHALKDPFDYAENKITLSLDDIVVGILMGGILIIYLLFLWLQLDYLILDSLPQDFRKTERIVKSGFWQLFFLSMLNTGLFFAVYKNTGTVAQLILRIFIAASGLLLLSAVWRMGMYVYWYGFSYEKFFASYTSLFALLMFIYLLLASFSKKHKDVFKFIAFFALWAYGVATIMPIERIILHSNVQLSQLSSSRINLDELKELSVDVIQDILETLTSESETINLRSSQKQDWKQWTDDLETKQCKRSLYEKNISLVLLCH